MLCLDKAVEQFRELETNDPGAGMRLIWRCLSPEMLRPDYRAKHSAIKSQGRASHGLSRLGLRVFGHCKTASVAYWLLMDGRDRSGSTALVLFKETMPDNQLHFWLQAEHGGAPLDLTAAQLSSQLYPHHNYNNGQPAPASILRKAKKHRIDPHTHKLLRRVIANLSD